MTGEERDITGAADVTELRTMRDSLTEIAAGVNQLVGRFNEHAESEEHWQDKVEEWMRDEPGRIQAGAAQVVASCRESSEPDVHEALAFYRRERGKALDEAAVKHWLSDRVRRTLVTVAGLCVFAALLGLTVLLVRDDLDHAAIVSAIFTAATPFLVLALRRQ